MLLRMYRLDYERAKIPIDYFQNLFHGLATSAVLDVACFRVTRTAVFFFFFLVIKNPIPRAISRAII